MTEDKILKIRNLKFKYPGADQELLKIDSFDLGANEKILLLGPSGSGKSTFLDLISGILNCDQGEIEIFGQKLNTMSQAERDLFRAKNLGIIFQQFNLITYLNVSENIQLPRLLNKSVEVTGSQSDWKLWAERLGLTALLDQPVSKLSVGQQQRVAVLRSLVNKPKLIIADEPTSALDSDARENFLNLLFELAQAQKTAVIFVSHDQSIGKYFDRVVKLNELNSSTQVSL